MCRSPKPVHSLTTLPGLLIPPWALLSPFLTDTAIPSPSLRRSQPLPSWLYVSHISEWSITDVQSYWSDITPAVVITIGLVLIFVINMLNVKM